MRLFLLLALVLAVGPAFVANGTRASHGTARLAVPDTSPFTVRGLLFVPRESVQVHVSVRQTWTRRVTAGSQGRFTVQFPRIQLGRCEGYLVRASGSRGSTAVLRVIPECAPD